MTEMELTQIILILLVGVGAGFVQRVSGFGLGIFAMMFLPHFMPTHTAAAAISCLFSCGTSTYNSVKYRKQIPFKIIIPLVGAGLITIPVAVHFSVLVSMDIFKIILGVVLICLSIYFLLFNNHISMKPTVKNSLIAGSTGGILNGLFSTGGPPIVIYLSHVVKDKTIYFAGIQFYFAITNIYATIFRMINGVITRNLLVYAVVGFLGCMAGDIMGKCVFDKLDAERLRTVIYIGMIFSGAVMLF